MTVFDPLHRTLYSDSSLLKSRQGTLEQNLIQVREHSHGITLEKNRFTNNSAIQGLVMIELNPQFNKGVLLIEN